ncbi:MAG: hypothetical protein A2900_02930 [Candidatus Chisholmbacteria bacterium RIFCSPLOWO2_01_FULL_50_28]|uniref:Uncharacterized protein n=1 Tax=Candidatus Chisholmbacteria bacterium RIFCSPHIGHO2_01_FULL_52_32 TaxID=1797591 RepID=A0A1G1VT67_9BACT|nr:MAG: hypothetical protein A2786_03815 [Candidatus Chisholmbacteria bacterium RIFCSPHIGHO2_01_FULL_52_32]OGY20031.1 MAG: hypothetical protein A2900_02930 [Candidatus Chisholmbacteria bacterium RIFCSPLOWO2_01_FULL_50_28]
MEQPLPKDLKKESGEGTEQQPVRKTGIEKILNTLKNISENSPKAKFVMILGAFAIATAILLSIASVFRGGKEKEAPGSEAPAPTPTNIPIPPRPTLAPEEIDHLLSDIDAFDPAQKDLSIPSVDLKIGL